MSSVNSWTELISNLIIDRRMSGEQVFQPFVDSQNIKVACLELFNQRNLDYDNIDQCVNKLFQADDQLNQTLSKLNRF